MNQKNILAKPVARATPLPHDSGYKLLFSHPRLIQDLLTGFIKPGWLNGVDLSSLEPYKASFVTDDLRQRHDDSIWRLRFISAGQVAMQEWLYLYLLIEFQSSDDYFMANRTMTYSGLLHQDLIRAYKLKTGDKLPPIMPIVLYNGRDPWTGPEDVKDLIQPVHKALAAYTPSMRYFLLQEKAVPPDYSLRHPDNVMGHLIALGQCRDPDEIRACIVRLQHQLAAPENKLIRQTFAIWISRLLRTRFSNDAIPEYQNLEEVNTMLARNLEDWVQDIEDRGIATGERHLLLKQITLKYGTPPEWAQEALAQADAEQLDAWGERILTADSLEALLGID